MVQHYWSNGLPIVHVTIRKESVMPDSMQVRATPLYANYLAMRGSIRRGMVIITKVDADVLALAQATSGSVYRNVEEINAMMCDDLCEMHYGRCYSVESHNPIVKAEFDTLFTGPVTTRAKVKRPVV